MVLDDGETLTPALSLPEKGEGVLWPQGIARFQAEEGFEAAFEAVVARFAQGVGEDDALGDADKADQADGAVALTARIGVGEVVVCVVQPAVALVAQAVR